MKVLMFLEHKFFQDEKTGVLYSQKVINSTILNRYLAVFDEVYICARKVSSNSDNSIKIDSNKIKFCPIPDYDFKKLIINRKKIRKIIQKYITSIDGIIIRAPSTISFLAMYSLKKNILPIMSEIVINPNHFFEDKEGDSFIQRNLKKYARKVAIFHTKKLCRESNAVLYVTKENLQSIYKSYDMLYGEDDNHFSVACSDVFLDDSFYSKLITKHNKGTRFVITHMGWMMGENKGQRHVLEVLSKLVNNGYDVECNFIGDGPFRSQFEDYAKKLNIYDRVIFLGQINSFKEIKQIFSKSHLFLFPSINEGLPRVIIEAMANSLPCIAYETDGIPELVEKKYLAEIADDEKIYNLVVEFIDKEELRESVCRRNYEKALEYNNSVLDPIRNNFYKKFSSLKG